MKKLKVLSIVSVLFLAMIISFCTVEAATESCSLKIGLSSSTTSINVGDEISVSVKINSVTGFDGIHLIIAKKVYDSSIFQYMGCNPQNGWDLRADSSNIILYRKSGDASTGTICTLKFKALKASTGIISLTDIDSTGDNGNVYFEDGNVNFPSISFKISEKVQTENKVEPTVPSSPRDNVTTTTRGDKVESKIEPKEETKVDTKTETASTTITTTTEVSKATLENNNTSSSNNTVSTNNNDSQNEVSTTENNVIFNNVGNNTNLNDNAILETLEVSSNTQASQTLEDSNLDTSIKDISIEVDNTSKTVTVIIISTVLGASVLGVTIYYFISIKKH